MRPLEVILVVAGCLALAARWMRPRNRQASSTALVMLVLLLGLHLFIDGMRWEMLPAYGMALTAAGLYYRDVRRLQFAKAGASAEWPGMPSLPARAAGGAGIVLVTIAAGVLPSLFPRVAFDELNGAYPVGRVDVAWVDGAREEPATADPGDRRRVAVSFWYPAERGGDRLRYAARPGQLAGDLRAQLRTAWPSFAFWNLVRAKTQSRGAPPFNIREGRSPLVLFSHRVGGSVVGSTFLFEQLASYGYVVASIEHPFGAAGAVAADGSPLPLSVAAAARTVAGREQLIATWVRDARFVLNRLGGGPRKDASDVLEGHVQLDKVAYLGHGLGGAVAADGVLQEDRISAGISYDAPLEGAAVRAGLAKPFLLFRAAVTGVDTISDAQLKAWGVSRDSAAALLKATERRIAALLRNGGTEIRLGGALSMNFTDLALWSPWLMRRAFQAGADDPADLHWAITSLTVRFLNQYLKGNDKATNVMLPAGVRVKVVPHQAPK